MDRILCIFAFTTLIAACSSPIDNNEPDDAGQTNAGVADAGDTPDMSLDEDQGEGRPDMQDGTSCEPPPTPMVAGTSETDALADAAARCGQPDHAWLRDESLGDVVEWGFTKELTIAAIDVIARQGDVDLPGEPEHDVLVRQFSYVTQDRGELIEATGLMAWPQDMPAGETLDIVLMPPGFNGVSDECAWSNRLSAQGVVSMVASFGYVTVMPDYIGKRGFGDPSSFQSPPLAGQLEAISSIDAVRAVAKADPTERNGLCVTPRFAVLGPSQGGHTALWVHRLAPYYGREFEFVGGVTIVPPVNPVRIFESDIDNITVPLAPGFAPVAAWYGADLAEILMPPWDADVQTIAATECTSSGRFPSMADATADTVLTEGFRDAVAAEAFADFGTWGCIYAENSLATTSIPAVEEGPPMLYVVATDDDQQPPDVVRGGFDDLCAAGMNLRFLECSGVNHHDVTFVTADSSVNFVGQLFAGEDVGADCMTRPAESCSE